MNIAIYQINLGRDLDRRAFESTDYLEKTNGTLTIESSIYDKVWEGEVDCGDLEGVFRKFNLEHPEGYKGRSLSVSDIVEVKDDRSFNFCDSVGFKKVDFEPALAEDKTKARTIRVVLVEPGKPARDTEIDAALEGLQRTVGGYIEAMYPFSEEVCIVCNEEGKINGMALNRAVYSEEQTVEMSYAELTSRFREVERCGEHMEGYIVFTEDSFRESYPEESRTYAVSSQNKAFQPNMGGFSIYGSSLDGSDPMVRLERYMADEHGGADGWKIERCYIKQAEKEMLDIIAGTFFICDCSGESFGSLSDEQVSRYTELFRYPERFYRDSEGIKAVQIKPKDMEEQR